MRQHTLDQLARDARNLADDCFHAEILTCSRVGGMAVETCLRYEELRPLTRGERSKDWTKRPFDAYDPSNMCGGCRAYWFAEQAAQQLHRLLCLQRRCETMRKTQVAQGGTGP